MTMYNGALVSEEPDTMVVSVLGHVRMRLPKNLAWIGEDANDECARGAIFRVYDLSQYMKDGKLEAEEIPEQLPDIGLVQVVDVSGDPTEPDISAPESRDVAQLDAYFRDETHKSSANDGREVTRWLGSHAIDRAGARSLLTGFILGEGGIEREYWTLRSTIQGRKFATIVGFELSHREVLASSLFRVLRSLSANGAPIATPQDISLFNIPLPAVHCGFIRTRIEHQELIRSGAGYSVTYQGPHAEATLYLYDYGLADVPSDLESEMAHEHFSECILAVMQGRIALFNEQAQLESKFALRNRENVTRFLGAEFSVERDKQSLTSFLFLTSLAGRYVKLRYTATSVKDGSAGAHDFLAAFVALLWPDDFAPRSQDTQ
jgi:hypothetical protein